MKFGQALEALKTGKTLTRSTWSSDSANISARDGIIYWKSNNHPEQSFHPNSGDMLADDWQEA